MALKLRLLKRNVFDTVIYYFEVLLRKVHTFTQQYSPPVFETRNSLSATLARGPRREYFFVTKFLTMLKQLLTGV